MPQIRPTAEEIGRRGEDIYEREIRDKIETEHLGKFLVLDVDTHEYEVDLDQTAAMTRMIEKNPDGLRYVKRVGFGTAHRLGGRLVRQT